MGMQAPPMAPLLFSGVVQLERHNAENLDRAGAAPAIPTEFPFIVQETGREPAKLEIEVQVLVKGPLLFLV